MDIWMGYLRDDGVSFYREFTVLKKVLFLDLPTVHPHRTFTV